MTIITTIIAFLGVLIPLIIIHEFGHYLAARLVGVRVDQFSIGFPPRLFGRKWGETEYLISWIPLGGYVRLFGVRSSRSGKVGYQEAVNMRSR